MEGPHQLAVHLLSMLKFPVAKNYKTTILFHTYSKYLIHTVHILVFTVIDTSQKFAKNKQKQTKVTKMSRIQISNTLLVIAGVLVKPFIAVLVLYSEVVC